MYMFVYNAPMHEQNQYAELLRDANKLQIEQLNHESILCAGNAETDRDVVL